MLMHGLAFWINTDMHARSVKGNMNRRLNNWGGVCVSGCVRIKVGTGVHAWGERHVDKPQIDMHKVYYICKWCCGYACMKCE